MYLHIRMGGLSVYGCGQYLWAPSDLYVEKRQSGILLYFDSELYLGCEEYIEKYVGELVDVVIKY